MLKLILIGEEIGLKQKAGARRKGVSTKTNQRYEFGIVTPSEKRLKQLAKIFNCSVDELKGDEKDV